MEQITRKDFHTFCENFAHEFILSAVKPTGL